MNKAGNDIYYCNFEADISMLLNMKATTKIKALIMGGCGTGKTSFMNKACNTNHKSAITTGSCTRDIVYDRIVQFPKDIFTIYDTPGTDSKKQALHHAMVLRASLTAIPFNIIIIAVKFDVRCEKTLEQFNEQLKIFKSCKSLVVMLVSCFDMVPQQNKNEALKIFQEAKNQYGIRCPIIIHSNITSNIKTVVSLLYLIGAKNNPLSIEIDDETYYQHFKIANPKKIGQVGEYISEIQKKCQIFIKAFKTLNKNIPDIDEYVSDLKLYMKFELKRVQDEQYKKYNSELNDEYITSDLYLKISKITHDYMQQADIIADKWLTKSVWEDYYKKTTDIRDMFKQCPNPQCGLIWMKVKDCDDTHCGNRPTNYFDYFQNKSMYRHQFSIVNESLTCTKNEMKKIDQEKLKKQRSLNQTKNKGKKEIGCNQPLIWNKLQRLPNIEQVLSVYYGTSNYAQIDLDQQFISNDHKKYNAELQKQVLKTKNLMKNSNI